MSALLISLIALVGTGITGLLSWSLARRSKSGNIETSEAETLWSESQAIRTELRNEAVSLRGEVNDLRKEVTDCHKESVLLQARLSRLEAINGG